MADDATIKPMEAAGTGVEPRPRGPVYNQTEMCEQGVDPMIRTTSVHSGVEHDCDA